MWQRVPFACDVFYSLQDQKNNDDKNTNGRFMTGSVVVTEHGTLIGIHGIELKDGAVHLVSNNSFCLDFVQTKVHVDLDLDL